MRTSLIFFIGVFFSLPGLAWWTQKKAPPPANNSIQDAQTKARLQQSARKIHLYMNYNGQLSFIQTGHALVVDQKHLITSIYNVGRFGKYPNHQLFLEQNGKMIPCLVQYLDFFNGAALLYSHEILIGLPQRSDFDFSLQQKPMTTEILNPSSNLYQTSSPQTLSDGIREFFQTQSTPPAHFSLAGAPLISNSNKITGLYLGKIQGDEKEYIAPLSKLEHLFEKAKLSGDTPPIPESPIRQFQSQFKAFQEKFLQSLSQEIKTSESPHLLGWKLHPIPHSLRCQGENEIHCHSKFPLMLTPTTESFVFRLSFHPLQPGSTSKIQEQIQLIGEEIQSRFLNDPKCKQYRIKIQNEDSQLHFCTEKDREMEGKSHSLFRAVLSPSSEKPLAIFFHVRSFYAEQISPLLKPLLSRVERNKE